MLNLKYRDSRDRAFGLGGMAVAMVVWDNEEYFAGLDLDAEPDSGLKLWPEFFAIHNSNLSAKAVWHDRVAKFQIGMGLLVANVLSRALVNSRDEISPQVRQTLVKRLKDEGQYSCDLTESEVETLFSKAYNYFHSVFGHSVVNEIVTQLADTLQADRHLDRDQVLEILAPLYRR